MRVLITGAAGLIGGEIASRLQSRSHRITALVHRQRAVRANDGTSVAVNSTIPIDISKKNFGWSAEDARSIARDHDVLIHCAATTRFDLPASEYRAINVDGTAHAIDLAGLGGLALLHMSTAYVCGARRGLIRESDPPPNGGFANGYEASKAAGEALVTASGLRFVIARPSIVMGHSETGMIRTFDTLYGTFRLMAEGRLRHFPARAVATLNFVPIDYVAQGIVELAERMNVASGGSYHLVSNRPVYIPEIIAAIASRPQFHAPVMVDPDVFEPTSLTRLEQRLFAGVAANYGSYLRLDPSFDDAQFRAVSGMVGFSANRAYLRRLIDYCVTSGYVSGARNQRTSG